MEQNCAQQISGDGCGWTYRSTSDRGHTLSPSHSGLGPVCTPSERSPGTCRGEFAIYFVAYVEFNSFAFYIFTVFI